jgi:fluoroquinolone transport system permease protein
MKKILKLALIDFKMIFRDPSLRVFLVLPVILFVLIVWLVPLLVAKYDFLVPYLPLMLVGAVIENTQMYSFISSMVLIDEKETNVAKAYGVVPLTKLQYILSRMLIPYLFTVTLNVILFWVQPFFTIGWGVTLILSMLAGLVVPVYVLAINSIAENRMQGMVYVKAFNLLVLVPIVAFFIPDRFKHLFGIFPTHWTFQSVSNATHGLAFGWMTVVGFLFFSILLWWVSRLFIKKHFV